MDWDRIQQKLHILSDAAKYDVSCSSSGSRRANQAGGIGNGAVCGICHTWSADGRCVSLLKILMTNRCIYDCAYCVNAASRESERAILTPEEIADVTIAFYRRNYIEGLFLSSGVYRSPDYTTELLIRTARILRDEKKFNGYIHMKGIPGTSAQLIRELGRYVDRLSVNIELPSAPSLRLLAPQKTRENILVPMRHIRQGILERREEKKHHKKAPSFVPAGQTTQLIVGATPDSDRTILRLSQALYDKVELKRVYYSAYVPAVTGPNLPAIAKPPLLREHRLYQADWLLRFYQFKADEILTDEAPAIRSFFRSKSTGRRTTLCCASPVSASPRPGASVRPGARLSCRMTRCAAWASSSSGPSISLPARENIMERRRTRSASASCSWPGRQPRRPMNR